MLRVHVHCIVVSLLCLSLNGCEAWREYLRDLAEQPNGPEEPSEPPSPEPSIVRAQPTQELSRGLIATVTNGRGLQVLDVRDPAAPRVLSELRVARGPIEAFYLVDNRALLVVNLDMTYGGFRGDVPAGSQRELAVLNVDLEDPAHPVLDATVMLHGQIFVDTILRRSEAGAEVYVFSSRPFDDQPSGNLEWVQLRGQRLSAAQRVGAIGRSHSGESEPRIASANGDWLVLAHQTWEGDLHVWRISSGEPVQFGSLHARGFTPAGVELPIANGRLRIPNRDFIDDARTSLSIDTFVFNLETDPPSGYVTSGRCTIAAGMVLDANGEPIYEDARRVHFLSDDLVMAWVHRGDDFSVQRYLLDAEGNCERLEPASTCPQETSPAIMDYEPFRVSATSTIAIERLDPAGELLALYSSERPSCPAALARVALPEGTHSAPPQSLSPGSLRANAADGTRETGLLMVPTATTSQPGAQLATHSDSTLTRRAFIPTPTRPKHVVELAGSKLGLVTDSSLHSYDARDLDTPVELGRALLVAPYGWLTGFADYVVRIRLAGPSYAADRLEVLPLTAAGLHDPVTAQLDLDTDGIWLKAGELFVNIAVRNVGETAQHTIQIYDLHDPTAPRIAGRLETTEIGPATPSIVGNALVFSHHGTDGALELDVVDLRDPDAPALLRPALRLATPEPNATGPITALVADSTLYLDVQLTAESGNNEHMLHMVDFTDPAAPLHNPRFTLPAPLRAARRDQLYTISESGTVTRLQVEDGATRVLATQTIFNGYGAMHITDDLAGHLYIVHQNDWVELTVLDAETLQIQATLPLDRTAWNPRISNGRLIVDGEDWGTLVINIQNPSEPRAQAFHQHRNEITTIIDNQIFSYGSSSSIEQYDARAENLR
jgi:hypothetical protein